MKDMLTENIKAFEAKIVDAVNGSKLPPIVVSMMLTNLLHEVNEARIEMEGKEIPEYDIEVPSYRDSDKQ